MYVYSTYMDPKTTPLKSSAKDVFSYLLMAILLVWSSVSLGALLWQCINVNFPDSLTFYYNNISDTARTAMAGLIVTWPLFLGISAMINKDLTAHPAKSDLWVRKWLLYFTLFVCGLVGIIDLVTLLNNFLSGELTTRFILKALVVLALTGTIFGYYLWDLRRNPKVKNLTPFITTILTSAVVVGALVAGFVIIGTPSKQRALRFDDERTSDLQGLQWQIVNHWQLKQALPTNLADLTDSISGYVPPVDPETKAAYEYKVIDSLNFELCATFNHESINMELEPSTYYVPGLSVEQNPWTHPAGRACFTQTIDPDLYPVTPKS
jgi:hypothetical protein